MANFYVYYDMDDDTAKHHLTLDKYGGVDLECWVLLAPVPDTEPTNAEPTTAEPNAEPPADPAAAQPTVYPAATEPAP